MIMCIASAVPAEPERAGMLFLLQRRISAEICALLKSYCGKLCRLLNCRNHCQRRLRRHQINAKNARIPNAHFHKVADAVFLAAADINKIFFYYLIFFQVQSFINPDLFYEFRNMAYQNHCSGIFIKRGRNYRNMAEIYVVCRLIKN